jgi:hypothetical protein
MNHETQLLIYVYKRTLISIYKDVHGRQEGYYFKIAHEQILRKYSEVAGQDYQPIQFYLVLWPKNE